MSFQEYAQQLRSDGHMGHVGMPVKVGIAAIGVVCACMLIYTLVFAAPSGVEIMKEEAEPAGANVEVSTSQPNVQEIYVHVAGCVKAPGMYALPPGARLAQAIEAAGGFTEGAATESVNLARELQDGEQIVVADVSATLAQSAGMASTGSASSSAAAGRVNINTADAAQLQTISGIGPAKAQKIIAYREANGAFKSVDDLSKVSGIGQKTLDSIRDQICV